MYTPEIDASYLIQEDFDFLELMTFQYEGKQIEVLVPVEPINLTNFLIKKNDLVLVEVKSYNPLIQTQKIYDEQDYSSQLENFFKKCQKNIIPFFISKKSQPAFFHVLFCYNGDFKIDYETTKAKIAEFQKNMHSLKNSIKGFSAKVFYFNSHSVQKLLTAKELEAREKVEKALLTQIQDNKKVEKALLTQIQDNQKLIKELELYKKKFGNISVEGQEEGEEEKKEP